MNSDTYKTIKSLAEGLYKEKGSRFVAIAILWLRVFIRKREAGLLQLQFLYLTRKQ